MDDNTLGVWIQPGLGSAWPNLRQTIYKLYLEKVQPLPFVPREWYTKVMSLQSGDDGALIKIAPVFMKDGSLTEWGKNTSFLDTEEKRKTWDDLSKQVNEIVIAYARNESAKGKVLLDKLYADAAFWDRAYRVTKAIADAPKTVVKATGEFASDIAWTGLKAFLPALLIVGGLFIIYAGRNQIAKKVVGE